MSQPLTANDLLPLVARLDAQERKRLVGLIQSAAERDAALYRAKPTVADEFATEDSLGWDAEGWDGVA